MGYNKKQLEAALKVSTPTLNRLLKEIGADQHIEEVGNKGRIIYQSHILAILTDLTTEPRTHRKKHVKTKKKAVKVSVKPVEAVEVFHVEHEPELIISYQLIRQVCELFASNNLMLEDACERLGIDMHVFLNACASNKAYGELWRSAFERWQNVYAANMERTMYEAILKSLKQPCKEKMEQTYKHSPVGIDDQTGETIYTKQLVSTKVTREDNILDMQAIAMAKKLIDEIKYINSENDKQIENEYMGMTVEEIRARIKQLEDEVENE